uniref:Uncharacterized protein n=1 Tax=Ditylenchus dipsaci TaxID=166011 RepID=A0A915E8C9_9BILA
MALSLYTSCGRFDRGESRHFSWSSVYIQAFGKSAISSVLEIKLISTHNPNMYKGKEQHRNEYVPVDKQVCTMKMLLLVNNGVFEYIQFIAPPKTGPIWKQIENKLI